MLQHDASLTAAEIAEQVNLSASPCWRRINRLEQEGLIQKKVALLDAERLGLGLVVFARIRLAKNDEVSLHGFEERVRAFAEVVECYTVTGSADYFLKIITRDIKPLSATAFTADVAGSRHQFQRRGDANQVQHRITTANSGLNTVLRVQMLAD
jgi:DNA-binding Lrp family transcriptional regulator